MAYYIYILECADTTLYIGSTNDLTKRVAAHNGERGFYGGAKYTKPRRPVTLKYSEKLRSKSAALKREWVLKKMSRAQKLELLKQKTMIR